MDEPNGSLLCEATTAAIIGSFRDVYREFGFGYRELIYSLALERALVTKGHQVDREVAVMIYFRGEPLARQTLDMVVDRQVIVELKATERLHPSASPQLFSYLCATTLEVGLLLHVGREARFYRVICENHLKRHGGRTVEGSGEFAAVAIRERS
jgi:GxxExxY protein